jgi:hypothetical protein
LIIRQRCLGQRTQHAINSVSIVAEPLQCTLHIRDNLVRRQSVIALDPTIILIIGVVGVVAPSGVPPTGVPSPITPVDQYDGSTMMLPPVMIVMMLTLLVVLLVRFGYDVGFTAPIA